MSTRGVTTLFAAMILWASVGVAAPARKKSAAPPPPAPPPTVVQEFRPSVSVYGGVAASLNGDPVGAKLGLKLGLLDLSAALSGLQLILPASVTLAGSVFGFEVGPGVEYRHPLGPAGLSVYGDLVLGYAFRQVTTQTPFVGNTYATGNAFMARLAAGISYQLIPHLDVFVEPANFGMYASSKVTFEYVALGGLRFSL